MNIFLRELKANRKALIIWSACMLLGVWSGMIKFASYTTGSGPSMSQLLLGMPASARALLGFGSFDVGTPQGYFAVLFIYLELAAAIHAALLGTGLIGKEEREKTAEFLMSKPVSRAQVVSAKLLAALFNVLVLNAVTLVSSLLIIPGYTKGVDITAEMYLMITSMLLVQLVFLGLGAALAALLRRPAAAGSIASGIVVAAYFAARMTDLSDKLRFFNVLSPFRFFDLSHIIARHTLSAVAVVLSLALTAVFFAATYVFYRKKDFGA